MNGMTKAWSTALILTGAALVVACSAPTGGGGTSVNIGGAPGVTCLPSAQSEGCYVTAGVSAERMSCDPASGQWKLIAACSASEYCAQIPAAGKFVTQCVAQATAPGADATSGSDTKINPGTDTASSGKDISGTPTGAMMQCVVQKCASVWTICAADPGCLSAALCIDGCGADEGCQYSCASAATGTGATHLASVSQCAQSAGCAGAAPVCGNGTCEAGETAATCAQDCKSGPVCGNGTCEAGETKTSCPADCGGGGPVCGNGMCEAGETKASCAKDCGGTTPSCGNGTCDAGETTSTCPSDCPSSSTCLQQKCPSQVASCQADTGCLGIIQCLQSCTDATCANACVSKAGTQSQNVFMTLNTCAAQCSSTTPSCGDGTCNGTETKTSCPADCGSASTYCGDGTCNGTESQSTCPSDCTAPSTCGDGTCQSTENANNCAVDCDPTTKCLVDACGTQINGCFGDTSCAGIFDCFGTCANGDQTCLQGCYNASTPAAQQLYMTYATCAQNSGCLPAG